MSLLKLRKIYHLKQKAILIGMNKQKKMDDETITILTENYRMQIEAIRKECENKIIDNNDKNQKAIARIRKDVEDEYIPQLQEARNALSEAQKEKHSHREYFNIVMNYGNKMEKTGIEASEQFQRARIKVLELMGYVKSLEKCYGELIQYIDTGKEKIEAAQLVTEKDKEKLIKELP